MNNIKINPIAALTELLTNMTERAYKAEQKVAELEANDNDWYHNWQRKDAEFKELKTKYDELVATQEAPIEGGQDNE